MAAEATVRLVLECTGLGAGVREVIKKFTDTNTPEDVRTIETVISTTANLLSSIVNIPSAEVCGMALIARDGDVHVNTISTNISTAGQLIPDGQGVFMTFSPGNSCVISWKGTDADTAVTGLVYSALTV